MVWGDMFLQQLHALGMGTALQADPSSQHSGNLLLSLLHPETPTMGIQYVYPNVRNQNDLSHNPAARLRPRCRPFSPPLALTAAPRQTGQGWAPMGPVRTFPSTQGCPGPISLSRVCIGRRLQTPEKLSSSLARRLRAPYARSSRALKSTG